MFHPNFALTPFIKAKKLYHWYGRWEHGFAFPTVKETRMQQQHNEELGNGGPSLRIERATNAGTTKKKAKVNKGGSQKKKRQCRRKSAYVHFLENCMKEKDKKTKVF